jgi:hypothetical protein
LSLRAFLTLNDNEFDSLSFFQAPVTFARDGTVVNKDIFALILLDEAKAFGGIEPLHRAGNAFCHDLGPPFLKFARGPGGSGDLALRTYQMEQFHCIPMFFSVKNNY